MERSFAAQAGFEHEGELLIGYSDLLDVQENGAEKTPEAVYTETVLKLDAGTYGIVDGQEGFLDNIRRGAIKVYEWIKSLIKAIRDWLFGGKKKEYAEATKNLKTLDISADVQKLGGKGIDGLIFERPEAKIPALTSADKAIINESIKKVAAEPEFTAKLSDKRTEMIELITMRAKRQLDMIGNAISEITRIDPTGETLKKLNIGGSGFGKFNSGEDLQDDINKIIKNLDRVNEKQFPSVIKEIIQITDDVYVGMVEGTATLQKLNEAAKGHDGEERAMSRAANVLNHFGTVSNALRNLVITIDSQIEKTLKSDAADLIKEALREAKHEVSGAANDYINIMTGAKMNK